MAANEPRRINIDLPNSLLQELRRNAAAVSIEPVELLRIGTSMAIWIVQNALELGTTEPELQLYVINPETEEYRLIRPRLHKD